MRILPAGEAIYPDSVTEPKLPFVTEREVLESTVEPSHNLTLNVRGVAAPGVKVTTPLANHVPDVPCATIGPSKYEAVLMVISAGIELVKTLKLTATVPVDVIVPPDNPVPAVTDVTVPGVVHDGAPVEFSVNTCDPLLLPGSVSHAVPFQ